MYLVKGVIDLLKIAEYSQSGCGDDGGVLEEEVDWGGVCFD